MKWIDETTLDWLIDLSEAAVAGDCYVITSDPMAKHAISDARQARSDAYTPPAPVLTEEERGSVGFLCDHAESEARFFGDEDVMREVAIARGFLARTATKQSAADAAGGE